MLLNQVKGNGKGFELLRLGEALWWSMDADQAGVQVYAGIFALAAFRVVRSPEVARILCHEAPVVLEYDRGEFPSVPM